MAAVRAGGTRAEDRDRLQSVTRREAANIRRALRVAIGGLQGAENGTLLWADAVRQRAELTPRERGGWREDQEHQIALDRYRELRALRQRVEQLLAQWSM
jgi:hypothetical protein